MGENFLIWFIRYYFKGKWSNHRECCKC